MPSSRYGRGYRIAEAASRSSPVLDDWRRTSQPRHPGPGSEATAEPGPSVRIAGGTYSRLCAIMQKEYYAGSRVFLRYAQSPGMTRLRGSASISVISAICNSPALQAGRQSNGRLLRRPIRLHDQLKAVCPARTHGRQPSCIASTTTSAASRKALPYVPFMF
jgi:hypothetical protein